MLLPGLDGTGEQFAPLLRELPDSLVPLVVRYPRDRALDYDALLPIVVAQLPPDAPFVLLGECSLDRSRSASHRSSRVGCARWCWWRRFIVGRCRLGSRLGRRLRAGRCSRDHRLPS